RDRPGARPSRWVCRRRRCSWLGGGVRGLPATPRAPPRGAHTTKDPPRPRPPADARLAPAVDLLGREEYEVSQARNDVLQVMDALQEELKRRYRDDPSLVLS